MDSVYDVLAENQLEPLKMNYNNQEGATLKNNHTLKIASVDDIENAIARIRRNRKSSKTKMNLSSSRSHAVFLLRVINPEFKESSTLSLVDLAGSERVKKSQTLNQKLLEETISINTSLTALSKCISAVVKNDQAKKSNKQAKSPSQLDFENQKGIFIKQKSHEETRVKLSQEFVNLSASLNETLEPEKQDPNSEERNVSSKTFSKQKTEPKKLSKINVLETSPVHIPFRDSKLTMILQNSLSGKSCLTLIITLSPDEPDVEESFSALRFGICASKIEIRTFKIEKAQVSPKSDPLQKTVKEQTDFPPELIPNKRYAKIPAENQPSFRTQKKPLEIPVSENIRDNLFENSLNYDTSFTFKNEPNETTVEHNDDCYIRIDNGQNETNSEDPRKSVLYDELLRNKLMNEQLLDELAQNKFHKEQIEAELRENNENVLLTKSQFETTKKQINEFLWQGKSVIFPEETSVFLNELRDKINKLSKNSEKNVKNKNTYLFLIRKMKSEQKEDFILQKNAVSKIEKAFINFIRKKGKKEPTVFQKIKLGMGKNFISNLSKEISARFKSLENVFLE